MSRIKNKILEVASEIFTAYPVAFAYLYGSYAKDCEHPFSDVDVSVYTENIPAQEKLVLQLAIALQIDETLGEGVDSEVRIMNDLPLVIKGQIVTEGLLIFSRDDNLRVEVETGIRKAYFDFLPVLHAYRQAFVEGIVRKPQTVQGNNMVSAEKITQKFIKDIERLRKVVLERYGSTE